MGETAEIETLFQKGLSEYEKGDYFEAHEAWEDLWSDYNFPDRKFIQGLIQLSVSFVHLGNGNLIGAKSLLKKRFTTPLVLGCGFTGDGKHNPSKNREKKYTEEC